MTLKELTKVCVDFRDKRDWKQFNPPKDQAIALSLEASEVLEHFLWYSEKELEKYLKTNKTDIADELADVLYWNLVLAHDLGIDLEKSFERKMKKNGEKYPVAKSKGNHKKYTQL